MPISPQLFSPPRIFAQVVKANPSTAHMMMSPHATSSTQHPLHPLKQWPRVQRTAVKVQPPWKPVAEEWSPNMEQARSTSCNGLRQDTLNPDGSIRAGYKLAIVRDPAAQAKLLAGNAAGAGSKGKKGKGKGKKGKGKGKDKRKGETKDADKGKGGKRQKKGDGKSAVPLTAPGAIAATPVQPILQGDLPKSEVAKTPNQQKGADHQWVRDAICHANQDVNPLLSRKAAKRVKYAVMELHRTAPILSPSNDAVKQSVIAAMSKEAKKAEEEQKRLTAKTIAAALKLQTTPAAVPTTEVGLAAAVEVCAVVVGDKASSEEEEASEGSRNYAESGTPSSSEDEDEKPVLAVVVPIPSDKKFWVCEIPLSDVENQNAQRHISSLLVELQERTVTRASYVSSLCIAQSVVFGAVPLQITKSNFEEEYAKKITNAGEGSKDAAEPASVAESAPAAVEEVPDELMEPKQEIPKSS